MKFIKFSKQLAELEGISSRNEMTVVLADFLKQLSKEEVSKVLYMMNGRIAPSYVPLEFNFSTKLIVRSLEEGYMVEKKELSRKLGELGDAGDLVEFVKNSKKRTASKDWEIIEVYEKLSDLALLEGTGSQKGKVEAFKLLIEQLDPLSAKYTARIIVGDLRLGLSSKTVLDAISWALAGDKSLKSDLEHGFGVRADIGLIAELALNKGIDEVNKLMIQPGIPVASKLVEREKSVEAAFERMGKCGVQMKYDGLRTQIHFSSKGFEELDSCFKKDGDGYGSLVFNIFEQKQCRVRIFSRNMESLTDMFPDIVNVVEKYQIESIVLDAEAIGYDSKTGKFISFQETIQRKRKYGIAKKAKTIPVKVFVFDVLYLNGKDLTSVSFKDRIGILNALFGIENKDFKIGSDIKKEYGVKILTGKEEYNEMIVLSNTQFVDDAKELRGVYSDALAYGLEGVIIKELDSKYVPGTRSYDWIKLKGNMDSELIDTVDCVVLGYYYGRGARAKFGAGAFLVGVYNKEKDRFETVAKVGSGIKDEDWPAFIKQINELKVPKVPKNVFIKRDLVPDIVCRPKIVVVVHADEISRSKNHSAGVDEKDKDSKGFSLRFPRLKEWGRIDKEPEQVTSVEELKGMVK